MLERCLRAAVSGGQLERRAGLEAQRRALAAKCKRRGWQLLEVLEEAGFSAEDLKRPGIQEALRLLEAGEAKALVARKRDRASRSLLELACLLASAQKQGSSPSTACSQRRRRPGRRW